MQNLSITVNGYVACQSNFYRTTDVAQKQEYHFVSGVHHLPGDIDSGVWAVSCLISMFDPRKPRAFSLVNDPCALHNGKPVTLPTLNSAACYLDMSHPLFRSKASVAHLIGRGLRKTGSPQSTADVLQMFLLEETFARRPLRALQTQRFQAMAAIAYAHGKTIFCFPWLSATRYQALSPRLDALLEQLAQLDIITIFPHAPLNNSITD